MTPEEEHDYQAARRCIKEAEEMARRRIKEAEGNESAKLDLSELRFLTRFPPELASLTSLQTLNLSGCRNLRGDLGPLAELKSLQYLCLAYCGQLSGNLVPLGKLKSLQTLDLYSCGQLSGNLGPLAELKSLRRLNLVGCGQLSGNLSPLAELKSLQILNLSGCGQLSGNLGPLAELKSLQYLSLGCEQLSGNLGPLAELKSLQTLDLVGCEQLGGDLGPLAELKSLQTLDLRGCELSGNLGPLAKLKSLQKLNLSSKQLSGDLNPLAALTSLQTLYLSGRLSGNLSPLAELKSLQWLYLSGCGLSGNLSPLGKLESLQTLNLSGCEQLSGNLGPLAELKSLQTLNLSGCVGIRRFSQLESLLPTLRELYLFNCKFEDLPSEFSSYRQNVLDKVRAYYNDLDSELAVSVTRPFEKELHYSRLYDVHLIFNVEDQAEFIDWIDEELRKRGIRPFYNRDCVSHVFDKDEVESIKSTPVSAIFLSQRGWGPNHRRFAQLAYDEDRPVIPIILESCSKQDREKVGIFQVLWITFKSSKDTDALNQLAQKIVNLPYEHATERDRVVVPEPPVRRLMVYVPARLQTVATWSSLTKKLENEQALNDCEWYPYIYTARAWSRDGIVDYARQLHASIMARVPEDPIEDSSRIINRITLMGHSFGGILARIAYLMSAGQYKEDSPGSEWWKKVDRIVLFAAPNRGIESKRYAWSERLAIYSPFGPLGRIIRDQLEGSEVVTNLRIRWIRFFAELDPSARPVVVQLLGKGDRLVSRDDSLDVEQFSQAWQYDVPGATHADLHIVPDDDEDRYNILRKAILGKFTDLRTNERTWPKRHPVVIVLHGIRANNEDWAAQIKDGIHSRAPNALAIPPTYRYFSMLEFAVPWLRAKKIRWFQDLYSSLLARYPRASFSFIGHSNGTYMLGHSLKRVPGMVFDRVTLVGSVLPREYDWDKRFTLGQVRQVTNHRSSFDVPVAILCNLLRALGMRDVGTAGFDGFDERRPEIEEVYYYNGGHGKPLEQDNLQHLIEHTLSGKAHYPNAQKDRPPGKLLSRLSGSPLVGLAVAGTLLMAFCLAIWLLASLLGSLLPWPPVFVWLFASLIVGATSYLFSRYY